MYPFCLGIDLHPKLTYAVLMDHMGQICNGPNIVYSIDPSVIIIQYNDVTASFLLSPSNSLSPVHLTSCISKFQDELFESRRGG